MEQLTRYFPYGVVVAAGLVLLVMMAPPRDDEKGMHLSEVGALPVMDGGRVKPLEGVARTTLMQISSRQSWRDSKGDEHSALEWLFDIVTGAGHDEAIKVAQERPAFRIESKAILALLGLPQKTSGVYTLSDLRPVTKKLIEEGRHAMEIPFNQQTRDEAQLVEMYDQVFVFAKASPAATVHKVFRIENPQVLDLLMLDMRPGSYRYSFAEILPRLSLLEQEANRAADMPDESRSVYDVKVLEADRNAHRYLALASLRGESLRAVPPAAGDQGWQLFDEENGGHLTQLLTLYAKRDADGFNKEADDYRAQLEAQMPSDARRASFEAWFNHAEPFIQSTWLFFCVFLLACASWIGWSEPLRRAAFWLMVLTLVVHTAALFARMYLMNRPLVFITNLYSTAIFIGWVGAIFGLVIEIIFRRGIGLAVGGMLGFLTAIIAHNLASGDTLEQVVAVLDTNFWLATHVTIINSGYAATFVAGLLGAGLLLAGAFTKAVDRQMFRTLGQILYGVLCFATLFSFVGTVLGGIWADQSWGRFWGWDPKENGALLIVLMNALILHARWAGLVQQRGMAALAVLGNIIVIWSWFQVNMLGVGLHSYGFIPSTLIWTLIADAAHLSIAAVALIPMRHWRSYAAMQGTAQPLPAVESRQARRKARRGKGPSTAISPA
jgi:ABC-type transport system involved in cytochrome c biogenesis permease subunit